jgi:hypothetical protein
MRLPPLVLLLAGPLAGLVAGCAGQLRDYVGPRSSIVRPQLIRYGFALPEIACVGERLGATLTPRRLRVVTRAAGAASQPHYDPNRFSPRDFLWVARTTGTQTARLAVERALAACAVSVEAPVVQAAVAEPPDPGPRPPAWLNLGAAGSGQAIAIDATSIEQEATTRTAWFRMINPPPGGPSLHAYKLRIDCTERTIVPLAHRLTDAAGATVESRDYTPGEETPSRVESGTVTEIAFLSLCS